MEDLMFSTLPREIMTIIVRKSVNSAGTYRNTIRVCKKWYMLIDHPAMESKYTNHIEKLLKLFPDKKWDYRTLSRNPNITWRIIQDNPDKSWNFTAIARNKFNR